MKNKSVFLFTAMPLMLFSQFKLIEGDTLTKEIGIQQAHTYSIDLEADQVAFLKLNQIGIDLAITTFDPVGKKLQEFDSPNGRYGPEPILLTSNSKGRYTLTVRSIDTEGHRGTYKLYLQKKVAKASSPFEAVDQIFLPWDTKQSPGAAVAIIQKGKVTYQNTYGSANLEYGLPITPKSVFRTGSVAKQFTAFCILLLEKEGKLSLEDPIRKYIPELPDYGPTITLKHLGNHTSGLREKAVLAALMGWDEGDIVTREQILKVMAKQKGLNFVPGEQYMYCNTGYTLLAEVVARVSGQSFAAFTNERIFKPLGMNDSQFLDNPKTIVKNKAYSYYESGAGYLKSILNDANPGSSGLLTTIEDLGKWVLNFETHQIGDAQLFQKMRTSGKLNDGTPTNYGLGIETRNYKGLTDVGHGGALGGFRARIATFPEQDFAVIVLANTPSIHPLHIPDQIVDVFLEEAFLPQKEPKSSVSEQVAKPSPRKEFPDNLPDYFGTYFSEELGVQYSLHEKGGRLLLEHPRLQIQLGRSDTDEFMVTGWADAKITFLRNEKKAVEGFAFSMINTQNITFIKR